MLGTYIGTMFGGFRRVGFISVALSFGDLVLAVLQKHLVELLAPEMISHKYAVSPPVPCPKCVDDVCSLSKTVQLPCVAINGCASRVMLTGVLIGSNLRPDIQKATRAPDSFTEMTSDSYVAQKTQTKSRLGRRLSCVQMRSVSPVSFIKRGLYKHF